MNAVAAQLKNEESAGRGFDAGCRAQLCSLEFSHVFVPFASPLCLDDELLDLHFFSLLALASINTPALLARVKPCKLRQIVANETAGTEYN
jgi:hypothetical protein